MAKAWKDVAASKEFQTLSAEDRAAARQQYFDEVVVPQIGEDEKFDAWRQFDTDTADTLNVKAPEQPGVISRVGQFLSGAVEQTKEDLGFGRGALDSPAPPARDQSGRASPVAPMRADYYDQLREASIADPQAAAKRAQVPDTTGRALTHIEDRRNARLEGQPSTSLSDIIDDQQVAPRRAEEPWSVGREFGEQKANVAIGVNNLVKGFFHGNRLAEFADMIEKTEKKYTPEQIAADPALAKEYATRKDLYAKTQQEIEALDKENDELLKGASPAIRKLYSLTGRGWTKDNLAEIGEHVVSNPRVVFDLTVQSGPASLAMILPALIARFGGASMSGAAMAGGTSSAFTQFGGDYAQRRADGETHDEAYRNALTKAGIIGMFDAASLGSAGRALGKITGRAGMTRKVWETAKELGRQAGYGMGGEVGGSLAVGETPDPVEVAAEGLGELGTGPIEIATMGRRGAKPAEQPGDRSPVDASRVLGRPDEALVEPSGGPVEAGITGTTDEPSGVPGVPPAPPGADAGVRTPITERARELSVEHEAAALQRDAEQERLVAEAGIKQAMTDEITATEATPPADLSTGTEQRSRPAGFEKLAQHMSTAEKGLNLAPVEPERVHGSLQRAAKFIEDAFGKKTVFVEADPNRFEGLIFRDDPSTIYVNTKSNRAVRRVMFHETLHTLKRSNPKVYGNLLRSLKGAVDFGAIAEEYGSRYSDRPVTEQVEEFAADLFGNFADDPRMWFQVFRATEKSTVKAIYKSVVMALDIIRMKMRIGERKSGYRATEMVRDIEGVRRAVAQAYSDFHGGKEPQVDESDDAAGTSEKRSILDFFANKDMRLFDEVQADVDAVRRQFPGYDKRAVEAKVQEIYAHRKNPKLVREVVEAMYSRPAGFKGQPSGFKGLLKRLPKDESGAIKGAGGMQPKDVWNLSQRMERMAKEGRAYKDWYKDSADEITKAFNGNKRAADTFSQIIAITSANTEVKANFTTADKALMQYARGEPISVGTRAVDDKLNDLLYFGIPWEGRKTNSFYRNISETIKGQRTNQTTQDMHMGMLALGKKKLTDDEYTFLDVLTKHVAKRTGMRPLEAQAAVWVMQKAQSLTHRYEVMGFHSDKSPAAKRRIALAEASINYGELVRRRGWFWPDPNTEFKEPKDVRAQGVQVTAEVKPSTKLDIGRAVQNLSVAKLKAYQKDALARTFGAKGPDALMEALGLDRSKYRIVEGAGGYDAMLAPNEIITLNTDRATAERVAKAWMYIFRQDAVPFFRADHKLHDDPKAAQAVMIRFAEPLSGPKLREVYDALRAQVNPGIGLTKIADNVIAIVNFRGDDGQPFLMPDDQFYNALGEAVKANGLGAKISGYGRFGAETAYPFHDWEAEPDGQGLLSAAAAGRPDLQERIRRWADNFGRYAAARARQGARQEVAPPARATPKAETTSEQRAPVARVLLSKPDPEPEVPTGIVDSLMQFIADRGKVNDRHGAADVVDHLSKKHLPELLGVMDKIGPEKRPTVLVHPGDEAKGIPTIWLLGWSTKEGTDIHDHGRSEAGVRVIRGQIKERVFGIRGNNWADTKLGVDAYVHERHLRDGSTVALPTPYIHEFFGDSSDVRDVTLHAYFPPLVEMTYFKHANGKLTYDGNWKQDDEEAEKKRIAKEAEKQKVLFSRPSVLARTKENLEQLQLGLGQWAPTKLGELKARGFDTSKVLYHQTSRKNAEAIKKSRFDLSIVGARHGDDEVPNGVFLKPTPRDIGVSDRFEPAEQLPVHVRFGKIATFANREAIRAHLMRDEAYAHYIREREERLKEARKEFAAAMAAHDPIGARRIEMQFNEDVAEIAVNARMRATQIFKNQKVDTVIIKDDEGGGDRHVQTVIALTGNQIALAEGQEHRVLFSRPYNNRYRNALVAYRNTEGQAKRKAAAEPIGVLQKLPEGLDFLKRKDGRRVFARGPVIGTVATIHEKGLGIHRSADEGRTPISEEILANLDDHLADPLAVYMREKGDVAVLIGKLNTGEFVSVGISPDTYAGAPVNFIKTIHPRDQKNVDLWDRLGLAVYKKKPPTQAEAISAGRGVQTADAAPPHRVGGPATDEIVSKTLPESKTVDDDAHAAATSPHNDLSEPSDKQKQAGNYIKGHPRLAGMAITIENPAGSERSGTDANGRKWSVTMTDHYGYIRGTEDRTGEQIDVFVKVGTEKDWTGPVFVANTNTVKTGRFDEYKVFIGWDTMESARASLVKNYSKGWDGLRSMVRFDSPEQFKAWLEEGDTKKPATLQSRPSRSRMTPAHEKEIRRIAQRVSDRVAERHNLPQRPLADKEELTPEEQADLDLMKDSLYDDLDPNVDPTDAELEFQQSVTREAMPELSGRARPGTRFTAPQLIWENPRQGEWESPDGRYKIMQFADGYAFYLDDVEKSFHRAKVMAVSDAELTFFEEVRSLPPEKNPVYAKSIMAQFTEEARKRVADGWRRLAENKTVFRFRSSDKKDIAEIISEMGNASVVSDVHDHGGFLKINFKDGTYADLVMPAEGVAFLQASQLKEGSQMGPVLYQAALVWAKHNKRKLVPDPSGLSYINSFRRTEQMLSGALRLGTTKYMRPHADQGLYGWNDDPKTQADEDHNIALMALTSMRSASEEVGIDGLRYNFETRRMEEEVQAGKWHPLSKDVIDHMAGSPDARNAGFGRTTLARAIFTKSLVEEVAGAKKFVNGDIPAGLVLAGDTSQSLSLYSVPDRFAPKPPGAGKRAVLATAKVATQVAKPFAATADAINATADLVSKIAGKPLSYITSRMYDRLTTFGGRFMEGGEVRQNIKHGMVSDYGLPEPYIEQRDQRDIDIQKTLRKSKQLIDNIAALDDGERRVAYVWMQEKPNEAEEQRLLALLPEGSRQSLAEMKQVIDQLGREAVELGLLSPESYERNKMAYLARSYEKHVLRDKQQVAGSTRAKAIRAERFRGRGLRDDVALERLPGASKGDYYVRLERRDAAPAGELGRLRRVVYLRAGQPIPPTYNGWRNDGVWEVRFTDRKGVLGLWRDFTRAERERMGEVQEVAFAFAKSVIGLVHDIETAKFLKWVMETYSVADAEAVVERGGKVADAVDKMTTLTTYGNDEWVQVPGTMAQGTRLYKYGLLQSRYIPGHIWNDIRATINFRSQSAMFRLYDQLLTAWKISKTALSPVVHTNNVMANFVFMDLADVKHTHLIRALQTIIDAERGKEDARATMERYLDSGAELGTPALHELKREVIEPLLAKIAGEENEVLASVGLIQAVGLAARGNVRQAWAALAASKTAQIAAKPFHTMLAAYQLEDSVYRMATWLKEVDEGKGDREAGADARKAFLDYRINAPWIASLRRGPLPFIAFTYRAVPLLAESFAKKPWKLLKYMGAAHALNGLAYAMLGLSGDDEDKERRLLPDEKSGYTILGVPRLLRMPWNDKHGNPVFLDIRRWVPAGDIYDVSGSQGAIPTPTWLSLGGYWGLAVELASNKSQFTGRDIWSDSDSMGERVAKVMDHLFKFVTPNVPLPNPLGYALDAAVVERGLLQTYAWKSIQDAGTGATDDFGREKSLAQATASAVGVKVASYPKDQLARNLRARRDAELRALNETTAKYRRENRRTTDEAQKKLFEQRMQKQAEKRAAINKRYGERLAEPEGLEPISR